MQIRNTEIVKKLWRKFFLHVFASSSNVFQRLINYVKSFCANGNRAKLKIVGSSCNTAADFLVSVMGRNGRESLTTSKNHDADINCGYSVLFFIYKCMDVLRVFTKQVWILCQIDIVACNVHGKFYKWCFKFMFICVCAKNAFCIAPLKILVEKKLAFNMCTKSQVISVLLIVLFCCFSF